MTAAPATGVPTWGRRVVAAALVAGALVGTGSAPSPAAGPPTWEPAATVLDHGHSGRVGDVAVAMSPDGEAVAVWHGKVGLGQVGRGHVFRVVVGSG